MHSLGPGSDDRLHLLAHYLNTQNNVPGYRALAQLIKAGYFSTILTTNLDTTLEDALLELGLTAQLLIVGRNQDEHIAAAFDEQNHNIRIVKLQGCLRERVLPARYPDLFQPPAPIRESLTRYLNQDIIILGSLKREDGIIRSITLSGKSNIYYVTEEIPSSDDDVVKALEARGKDMRDFVISGLEGNFNVFFIALAINVLPAPTSTSVTIVDTPTSLHKPGAALYPVSAADISGPENKQLPQQAIASSFLKADVHCKEVFSKIGSMKALW